MKIKLSGARSSILSLGLPMSLSFMVAARIRGVHVPDEDERPHP